MGNIKKHQQTSKHSSDNEYTLQWWMSPYRDENYQWWHGYQKVTMVVLPDQEKIKQEFIQRMKRT